jgi:hypothetical protein
MDVFFYCWWREQGRPDNYRVILSLLKRGEDYVYATEFLDMYIIKLYGLDVLVKYCISVMGERRRPARPYRSKLVQSNWYKSMIKEAEELLRGV